MNTNKIIYWIATALFCGIMLMSAGMYLFKHEMVAEMFVGLGHPAYIIYPLAIAKILGVIAIITKKSKILKEWAYAGFFFDVVLAFSAHLAVQDGGWAMAAVALVAILVSRIMEPKVFKTI